MITRIEIKSSESETYKMPRAKRIEDTTNGLEMQFEKVIRTKQTYELDARLVNLIDEFAVYVKTVRDVQPTPAEIIERAMFDLLKGHATFQTWRENGLAKGRLNVLKTGKDVLPESSVESATA